MQLIFIRSDANIIDLTLNLSQKVLLGLLSVAISISAASVMVGYFHMGVVGLCLGIMSGRLILTAGYPLLISRFLDIPLSAQMKGVVRPMLVTILLFGSALFLDNMLQTMQWPGLHSWIGFFLSAAFAGAFVLM